MEREAARIDLFTREPDFLPKAKKGWICPKCGNGSGRDGTGITKIPSNKTNRDHPGYKCPVCGLNEDNIGLYKIAYNVYDDAEAFNQLYKRYGIILDEPEHKPATSSTNNRTQSQTPPAAGDLTAYYRECQARLTAPEAASYLSARGISFQTAAKYGIGYDPAADPAQSNHPAPRIIIPCSNSHYVGRSIDPNTPKQYAKLNCKGATPAIFNEAALNTAPIVFVTEGVFDALALLEAGAAAIAINSAANTGKVIDRIKRSPTAATIVICPDNDEAGRRAAKSLARELDLQGVPNITAEVPTGKDANASLIADRAAFLEYVKRSTAAATAYKARYDTEIGIVKKELEARGEDTTEAGIIAANLLTKEQLKAAYPSRTAAAHLQSFLNAVNESKHTRPLATGFSKLDEILDGGLYPGTLTFIGAVSSLGKTTLALQIGDNIAAAGNDVLIFSLEQSEAELLAKSISRNTYTEALKRYGSKEKARTSRGILSGHKYRYYTDEEKELIKTATRQYGEIAQKIYIHEGVGDLGYSEITDRVQEHIDITGNIPLVIIDYLQILDPADPRATDKMNTDKAVLELKRLARDTKAAIIAISTFNRQSYTDPVNFASFKESGAIEYTSDILIGLQLFGMDYIEGESNDARTKRIREIAADAQEAAKNGEAEHIEVKILKNRNGSKGSCVLDFVPAFNYYSDSTATLDDLKIEAIHKPDRYQAGLEKLTAAFRAAAGDNNMIKLDALAKQLRKKASTVKSNLKEYPNNFIINGDTVEIIEGEV